MYQDEIVEEIHRIREEYSRSFNCDLKAIFADLQKQQAESGREVVNFSRKRSLTRRNPLASVLNNQTFHCDRQYKVRHPEKFAPAAYPEDLALPVYPCQLNALRKITQLVRT